jgi:broad specificity phosphatase PhoE
MSYASDRLGPMPSDREWLPNPTTAPLDFGKDPYLRERGAANVAMIPFGEHQLHVRGQGFAQQLAASRADGQNPRVLIHTSPWDRTKKSAQILQHYMPDAKLNTVSDLAPQAFGDLEGQVSSQVKDQVHGLRNEYSNVVPPGISPLSNSKGESTDHYRARLIPFIKDLMSSAERHPAETHIVAAHSSDMREIRRMLDPSYDPESDHIMPARTDALRIENDGQWYYHPDVAVGGDRKIIPGIYLQHHGATEFSTARPEMTNQNVLRSILPRENATPPNPSALGNANAAPATNQY